MVPPEPKNLGYSWRDPRDMAYFGAGEAPHKAQQPSPVLSGNIQLQKIIHESSIHWTRIYKTRGSAEIHNPRLRKTSRNEGVRFMSSLYLLFNLHVNVVRVIRVTLATRLLPQSMSSLFSCIDGLQKLRLCIFLSFSIVVHFF